MRSCRGNVHSHRISATGQEILRFHQSVNLGLALLTACVEVCCDPCAISVDRLLHFLLLRQVLLLSLLEGSLVSDFRLEVCEILLCSNFGVCLCIQCIGHRCPLLLIVSLSIGLFLPASFDLHLQVL